MSTKCLAFVGISSKEETLEDVFAQLIEDGEKIVQLIPEQQASSQQLKFMKTLEKAKKFLLKPISLKPV